MHPCPRISLKFFPGNSYEVASRNFPWYFFRKEYLNDCFEKILKGFYRIFFQGLPHKFMLVFLQKHLLFFVSEVFLWDFFEIAWRSLSRNSGVFFTKVRRFIQYFLLDFHIGILEFLLKLLGNYSLIFFGGFFRCYFIISEVLLGIYLEISRFFWKFIQGFLQ